MADNTTDSNSDGTLQQYIDEIKNIFQDSEETSESDGLDFVVRPSSENVAIAAYRRFMEQEDVTEDELPFDNPRTPLLKSELRFALLRDDVVTEIERIMEQEQGSVTGAEIDTLLYLVEKNAGRSGQFTIMGGAESLVRNIGEKFGWHEHVIELVLYAQDEAARRNNLHRHLMLDTAIVIPNDPDFVTEEMQQDTDGQSN